MFRLICAKTVHHDAFKDHFPSLKTDLIFLQRRDLEGQFLWYYFANTLQFSLIFTNFTSFLFTTSPEDLVDEDDNDKFRLKKVNKKSYLSLNKVADTTLLWLDDDY